MKFQDSPKYIENSNKKASYFAKRNALRNFLSSSSQDLKDKLQQIIMDTSPS